MPISDYFSGKVNDFVNGNGTLVVPGFWLSVCVLTSAVSNLTITAGTPAVTVPAGSSFKQGNNYRFEPGQPNEEVLTMTVLNTTFGQFDPPPAYSHASGVYYTAQVNPKDSIVAAGESYVVNSVTTYPTRGAITWGTRSGRTLTNTNTVSVANVNALGANVPAVLAVFDSNGLDGGGNAVGGGNLLWWQYRSGTSAYALGDTVTIAPGALSFTLN